MHFIVIGAGAIGGSAAAYLIRAGYDVLLVENAPAHVHAIETHGLTIEGRQAFRVSAAAVTPDALGQALRGRTPEAVILAVKSQHTGPALEPILPLLGPESFVVSMQNGLNPRTVAEHVGRSRTLAAMINSMGADYLSPGRIMYGGPGTIYLGELDGRRTPRVERLGQIMQVTWIENTQVTENVWGYLWGKEGYGAMLFASATVDEPMADVLENPANRPFLADLAGEVIRVADAEGVRCEAFDGFEPDAMRFAPTRNWTAIERSLNSLAAMNRRSAKQKSGIWRDLAVRHRPTEVDAQMGAISEVGRARGVPTPLLDRVVELIHDIEREARPMQPSNLEELRELDRRCYPKGVS